MKRLLVLPVLAATAAILLISGCGGGGDDSGGGDPASFAPPETPLYVEATIEPQGETKSNVEALFEKVSGIDTDLGELITSKLEESASESGEGIDFDKEIKPWLGEKAGISFKNYDGDDFNDYAVAIQTTDADAAAEFVKEREQEEDEAPKEGSYDGNDYFVEADDGTTIGVVGDFLVIAEGERSFENAVDASSGESLADEDSFTTAIAHAADGSLADVFVDVGALIEQSGGEVDAQAKPIFEATGIEPEEATAVASLVPGTETVEIDLASDLGGQKPATGDASKLLGSLPASSFAAIALPGFGEQLGQLIDGIDENGIPGEIPPGKFKSTLKQQAGIDLDKITGGIGNAAVFAHGSDKSNLGGAVVFEVDSANEASNLITEVGLLIRLNGTPGVTALGGKIKGFSIRSDEIGPKPLVVASKGERVAIGYGTADALTALDDSQPAPLSADPAYKEAVSSLGGTPISGFADGPAALGLVEAMISPDEKEGLAQAKPYLKKIAYLSLGSKAEGDLATAKLLVGLEK